MSALNRIRIPVLGLVVTLAACSGSVGYHGSVLQGSTGKHQFDESPNPSGSPPIEDATLYMCICLGGCERCTEAEAWVVTHSEADGFFDIPDQIFGGSLSADQHIEIVAAKDGYEAYVYRTVYESAEDPMYREAYLVIQLAPEDGAEE